ncbi:hypothetical protein DUNSADRAFT_9724 [Dunaliella salina]|uniref:Encoded protein n=1 Tax=Dunaliella salina TaxID=3046 RepID=A0ABQ7GGW9_DUNSA|nr:hypothetical protein DUNSADRAFT_9724 [Dunaliella salina]|eukprot:KAF5833850.1 hypothetical protein DUNSADRAFT_9724 [Dunaliella salina]
MHIPAAAAALAPASAIVLGYSCLLGTRGRQKPLLRRQSGRRGLRACPNGTAVMSYVWDKFLLKIIS